MLGHTVILFLIFWRRLHVVFLGGCTNLQFHPWCTRVPFLHILASGLNPTYFCSFDNFPELVSNHIEGLIYTTQHSFRISWTFTLSYFGYLLLLLPTTLHCYFPTQYPFSWPVGLHPSLHLSLVSVTSSSFWTHFIHLLAFLPTGPVCNELCVHGWNCVYLTFSEC